MLQERHPERVLATNVEYYSAVVLDIAEIPHAARAGDVRLLARRRLVGAHPRAEAHRPAHPALGPVRGPGAALLAAGLTLARGRRARRTRSPTRATSASSRRSAHAVGRRARDGRPEPRLPRCAPQAYRAIAQFRFRQKLALLRRGLEDESPACRGSALVALESLSRDHPGVVNQVRPQLHSLADADDNQAVRRLAIVCLKNGSPQPDTIRLLKGLAEDDEQDRELRETARKVAELLRKKAGAPR